MFGIGWPEFLVILAVAVFVIGPNDLPQVMRGLAKLVKNFRKISQDFQTSVDSVLQEAELDEIVREANKPGNETMQMEIERQIQREEVAQKPQKQHEEKNAKD